MKRTLFSLIVAFCLFGSAVTARAHDAYDDSQTHPLRVIAYAIHPVGFALEWLVFRPLHFVVSHPRAERVFGHTPHENPFGGYQPYDPESAR